MGDNIDKEFKMALDLFSKKQGKYMDLKEKAARWEEIYWQNKAEAAESEANYWRSKADKETSS